MFKWNLPRKSKGTVLILTLSLFPGELNQDSAGRVGSQPASLCVDIFARIPAASALILAIATLNVTEHDHGPKTMQLEKTEPEPEKIQPEVGPGYQTPQPEVKPEPQTPQPKVVGPLQTSPGRITIDPPRPVIVTFVQNGNSLRCTSNVETTKPTHIEIFKGHRRIHHDHATVIGVHLSGSFGGDYVCTVTASDGRKGYHLILCFVIFSYCAKCH